MKLIHLTDTHFVPPGETLYGGDPKATLTTAVAEINTHHGDADLVVVTGDLTHWGEPEAFASLADTLSVLTPPLRLLIGNHDDRAAFRAAFPEQKLDENGFVQSVEKTAAGHMILLDTNLVGTHAGWFCETRRAWLSARLSEAEAENAPVFLFMHHPPFDIGLAPLDRISLQEKDAFAAVVDPHRARVRHLFFGHIHRPLAGSWRGIPISTLRAMNHQCALDFSALGDIEGSFEPPAYSVVLIDDDTVIVHTHDFLDPSPRFSLRDSPVDDWAKRNSHP
jgi:Icc protein